MALSVLNNIPSLVAQNNLAVTNNNLQNTLFQLSSGSRINSGADDPAGLSIVNGLQANISALTQSSQNATDGVGLLQVADGALSQVTTLLNRAVTLATEAANGGLTPSQSSAITNEYSSIVSEINRIGNATNFNGTGVFQSATVANPNVSNSTAGLGVGATTGLTSNKTFTLNLGSTAYTFTPGTSASAWYTGSATLNPGTQLNDGNAISVTNGNGTATFTSGVTSLISGTITGGAGAALTSGDTFTATNGNGNTGTFTASSGQHVSDLVNFINTNGASLGISAYVTSGNKLVVQEVGSGGNLTVSGTEVQTGGDVGAMSANTTNTVGDLMNYINNSGYGLTASLSGGNTGTLNIKSTGGNITISNNTMSQLGTLSATSSVQDLVNWINGLGVGVSAGVASVTSANQLSGSVNVSTPASLASGDTLTIKSGAGGANSYTYTYATSDTTANLIADINASGEGFHAFLNASGYLQIEDQNNNNDIAVTESAGMQGVVGTFSPATNNQLQVTDNQSRDDLSITDYDTALGSSGGTNPTNALLAPQMSGAASPSVFISDGEVGSNYNTIPVQIGPLSSTQIGSNSTTLNTANLGNASGAASALTVINGAISDVASMRGTIGAGINRLNSATNVINTQIQNLTSAQSSIQDANVGQVVANLSKYQILEQTGIAALAQANQNEQAVLKLLT